uniref:Uncharacterized protein n=1 Tax=Rhizophora mucronata TaxID=61149 RepID=A0A2P2MZJ4_RHIMU
MTCNLWIYCHFSLMSLSFCLVLFLCSDTLFCISIILLLHSTLKSLLLMEDMP